MRFAQQFNFPPNLAVSQRVVFLKQIVGKYKKEAVYLRKTTSQGKTRQGQLEKEVEIWKDKYQKVKQERDQFKKENGQLKLKIERLTKTNNRYQVSLFDHGNFKSPDNGEKKPKGGQLNHPDTNRERQTDFSGYESFERKRIYARSCGKCGSNLDRVNATKEKVLVDIVIKPEIIQMILESERQWCKTCKTEVNAKGSQSLPFSEYGLNTFLMIMILRFKAHCSLSTTGKVIEISFGLKLSKSDVSNILKAAAKYLGSKYEELKQAARDGNLMYMDETGWQVLGQSAWMWIMTTEDADKQSGVTVYVAAESRGKGIAEEMYGDSESLCMTDGFKSYTNTISKDKHLFCWAHVLRFAFEETIHDKKDSMSIFLRDELVRIYHIKKNHPQYSKHQLEEILTSELNKLLKLKSEEISFKNIQNRVADQRQGLIQSLLETDSGTNNLAERELRELVLGRKVSFGSDTYQGMETTAVCASVVQTLSRDKQKDILTELTLNLQIGIHEKYPQYTHLAYFDTS